MRNGIYPDGVTQQDIDRAAGGYEEPKDGMREHDDRPAIVGESQIHFDGGDIDDRGHWSGEEICCIACHKAGLPDTSRIRIGFTSTYLVEELYFDECGEPIVWIDRLKGGIRL
jgi:hypothetical protein